MLLGSENRDWSEMDSSSKPIDEVVEEIMRIHRSLPARPGIDEVEAAKTVIQNVEKEDQARIEAISRQRKVPEPEVPEELFMVLKEMQKNLVYFQSKEQKGEAMTARSREYPRGVRRIDPESLEMRSFVRFPPAQLLHGFYFNEFERIVFGKFGFVFRS